MQKTLKIKRSQPRFARQLLQGGGFALRGLGANDTAAIIVRRAPFADVFDMAEAAEADFLLVQPTHTAAWRRHRRADIAVERFRWADRRRLGHDLTGLRNRARHRPAAGRYAQAFHPTALHSCRTSSARFLRRSRSGNHRTPP